MRTWQRFILYLTLGLSLGLAVGAYAQKLSRTTPIAGGPPQGPNGGYVGDYDSGITALPGSLTVLTTNTVLVENIYCAGIATGNVTITNSANTAYVSAVPVNIATTTQFLNGGKGILMAGIKWFSTGTTNCQIAGYQ